MGNEQVIKKIIPPKEVFEQICKQQESKQNPLIFSSKIFCDIFQELETKGYILTSFIGQVGLGTIFEAQKGNEFFAIKCLATHNPDDIQKEINLLDQLKINSTYFQTFKEGFYSEKCHIYFYISERLSCNLLKVQETYLSKNQKLCYNSILAIAIQISKALCILEENNIYHNEIIPENIMYDNRIKAFKLGDIGISQIKKNVVIQQTHREMHKYFAPEKVKQIKESSLESDIYSLGIILVELTCGKLLTYEETNLIRKGFVEKYLNQEDTFKDLNEVIKQMLCLKKENRFKPRQLVEQLYSLQRIEEIQFQSILAKKQKIPKLQQIKLLQQFQKSFQEIDISIKDQPEQLGLSVKKSFTEINSELQNFEQQLVYSLNINASESQMGQDGANKIGQILQRCQYLTNLTLNLQNNSLNAEAAKIISSNLQNSNNLINLKLNYNMNSIKSEGVQCIFKKLQCYKNLNTLNVELEQNTIGPEATISISEFIQKCTNLNKLNLSLHLNQIQREGAQFICSSLEKCYNMIELNLDLGDNQIGLEGAKNIGYSIERCFSIQTLFLNLMSITQSPGRYYVNNSKIEIQQPVHKTKYFSGKKENQFNNAAPTFDEYDKLLDQEKAHKQLNIMNREVGELRSDKQALENEKKQKDYEIQKLLAEKEYLMRNATQNNGKLKDIKKSNIYNVQEENDKLRRELDDQKQKELQMQTMIQNQKQQIVDLESRYRHTNNHSTVNGRPKPLLTEDDEEGANPKKFGFSQGNYGNQSSRNNTPTNSFRLRKQKYITPNKEYPQSTTNGLKIEEWQPRNFTPHDQTTERRRSLANNKSIFQDPSLNPTYLKTNEKTFKSFDPSVLKEQFSKIQPFDYDTIMPGFDPNVASRDEMNQYIGILKKQFAIQERKYINEIENLRIKIQRIEIEKLEVLDQSKQKELQVAECENKLKDREKELSLAYIRLKNPDQKLNNASNYSVNTLPLSRQDLQKNSRIQNIETLKGSLSSEDLMIIATHSKLSKITIWSSSDRIQGLTFQYTKPDGNTLEADNSYFFQRNYRYDTFAVQEEDVVQIIGKYNIKGVKYIQINNQKGPHKKYRPVGIQEEESDTDESFVIPINRDCNILKVMFPNIFSYDMKGAKIYDRHHQNFIYVETNRISSLQNAEVIWNREVLDRKGKKDPMEGKRTDSPPRSYNIPGAGKGILPQAQVQNNDENSESTMNPEGAKYYYSDNIDAYKLNEVVDSQDGGRINFSDGELIFMEKKLKIFKVLIWADENYVYGLKFSYLTPDGFNLIEGKQHAGIDIQHLSYKEVDLSNPEIFLSRIYFYRRDNLYIEKLVFLLSNGQKFSWGRQVPSREAKECLIELKQVSSYVYGSLIPIPQMQTPGQLVLSNLRVSEIR
ncbi:hypothetical protein ABPG73_008438 [Tetrahymena malaccensis]